MAQAAGMKDDKSPYDEYLNANHALKGVAMCPSGFGTAERAVDKMKNRGIIGSHSQF